MAEYVVVDKEQLEADLTTVADAIRAKGGTSEKLAFPDGMVQAVGAIESGNDYHNYIASLSRMFKDATFPENYTLHLDAPNLTSGGSLDYFLQNSNIYKVVLSGNLDCIAHTYLYTFNGCSNMVELDISNFNFICLKSSYTFGNCSKLKRIIGQMDFSNCIQLYYPFNNVNYLEEIRFKEATLKVSITLLSTKLTAESIQSIINGLADLSETDAQTLTLHADVKEKLTEEQIESITSKNWTLA